MGLMKDARGLPRFMMDCGFWRSPKWRGAKLGEIGLFSAAVSYCYEHETDGRLPHSADLAQSLGLKEVEVRRMVADLVKRNVMVEDAFGVAIVGFLDHNPSSAEIRDRKQKRVSASSKATHARYHKATPQPDCEWCVGQSESQSGSHAKWDATTDCQEKRSVENPLVPTEPQLTRDQAGRIYVVPGAAS